MYPLFLASYNEKMYVHNKKTVQNIFLCYNVTRKDFFLMNCTVVNRIMTVTENL